MHEEVQPWELDRENRFKGRSIWFDVTDQPEPATPESLTASCHLHTARTDAVRSEPSGSQPDGNRTSDSPAPRGVYKVFGVHACWDSIPCPLCYVSWPSTSKLCFGKQLRVSQFRPCLPRSSHSRRGRSSTLCQRARRQVRSLAQLGQRIFCYVAAMLRHSSPTPQLQRPNAIGLYADRPGLRAPPQPSTG